MSGESSPSRESEVKDESNPFLKGLKDRLEHFRKALKEKADRP
jgi:hypothetical protein